MDPTAVMMDEHRVIQRMLFCLERLVSRALDERKLDGEAARDAVRFLRGYADGRHHAKEETLFFPMLEAKGLTRDESMLGDLLAEHDRARDLVGKMEREIDAASAGDRDALGRFAVTTRDYVRMLRRHIRKEDDFLFPAGELSLDDAESRVLAERFREIDGGDAARDAIAAFLAIAERLADRLGVPEREPHRTEDR